MQRFLLLAATEAHKRLFSVICLLNDKVRGDFGHRAQFKLLCEMTTADPDVALHT